MILFVEVFQSTDACHNFVIEPFIDFFIIVINYKNNENMAFAIINTIPHQDNIGLLYCTLLYMTDCRPIIVDMSDMYLVFHIIIIIIIIIISLSIIL